jgi:ubiquinone biosynthesis protein
MIKVRSIPSIYRNVKRWTEILSVLSKYGLADWLAHTHPHFHTDPPKAPDGGVLARPPREARLRHTLAELGPTFIKLGQLLSTRPDVVGKELALVPQTRSPLCESFFNIQKTTKIPFSLVFKIS